MATFTFVSSQKIIKNNKASKPLTKKEIKGNDKEYFTYIDKGGKEQMYTANYIKHITDDNYQGKIYYNNVVKLTYHPEVENIASQASKFTYIDDKGNVQTFTGTPLYDNTTYSYFFETNTYEYINNKVELYTKD